VFYLAHKHPEDLAAATSRRFLGLRLECAQCHDHPFSEWKQREFWNFAAFFAGIENGQDERAGDPASTRAIRIPGTDMLVQPRFLDGRSPDFESAPNPRQVLAKWIASEQNPYFARAIANSVWAELFGFGIVDPPDDLDAANPPSHPQLLEDLAAELAAHDFDVRFLIRAITTSRAYQLTSIRTHASQDNGRLFARRVVRGLSADQLYDSLIQATGHHDPWSFRSREREFDSPRMRFRQQFEDRAQRPVESQTTILLATLSRRPRSEELVRMLDYMEANSDPQTSNVDRKSAAFADLFWALVNSSEFGSNH
jgi:hypothetical protein